jgi:hypothetical protein
VSYALTTVAAHRAARGPDKVTMEKLMRLQATLATKLRLTPQSRVDRKVAHLQPGNVVSYYDRMGDEP